MLRFEASQIVQHFFDLRAHELVLQHRVRRLSVVHEWCGATVVAGGSDVIG